jgi:hypothetical protein
LIGLVVLIAVATVAAVELRAFYAANQAVKKLEKAQDQDQKDKSASTLTKERVQSIVGKAPSGPDEKEGMQDKQTYVWRGIFRKYKLTAFFEGGEDARMQNFSTE